MGISASLRRVMAAAAAVLSLTACQPVEAPPPREVGTDPASAPEAPGAPATSGVPQGLAELQARLETIAREWQAEPIIGEVRVELDGGTAWSRARVTYIAADADRLLLVDLGPDGMAQQRPTFATLGLEPVTAAGAAELPPFPEEARDPQELAAAAAPVLDDCGFDRTAASVLYASGAPVDWDGQQWTEELIWTATVATDDGEAVRLDPVTAEPVGHGCLGG